MSSPDLILNACDPQKSVVVEACAGSGKTWLLVSRVVRLLLAGFKPHEILAITFTRKAAQEMKARLEAILLEFRDISEDQLLEELQKRGMSADDAKINLPKARKLYEQVLSDPRQISIDTFHGWFSRLTQATPIGSGFMRGGTLREDSKRLVDECLEEWWALLGQGQDGFASLKRDYETLLSASSEHTVLKTLLGSQGLIHQRSAWLKYLQSCDQQGINHLERMKSSLPLFDQADPLGQALSSQQELANLREIAKWLSKGSGVKDLENAARIEQALLLLNDDFSSENLENFASIIHASFLTANHTPLDALDRISAGLKKELLKQISTDEFERLNIELPSMRLRWAQILLSRVQWKRQNQYFQLYQAWSRIGKSMLDHYEQMKGIRRVQDFSDLEWQTSELMRIEHSAAYLQARLDARYKHILIDEFQDTNPIQWQILQGWLSGYSNDMQKPTVFIVGDPKQSIYRFRKADARLFEVAKQVLSDQFSAHASTYDETRRNSPGVLQAINAVFEPLSQQGYPFRHQETYWLNELGLKEGGFAARLPLIPYEPVSLEPKKRHALVDPLEETKNLSAAEQHYQEAIQVGKEILRTKSQEQVIEETSGKKSTRPARWDDFLILVRTKTHLLELERAFRQLGIPLNSPRQGGLLQTLEVGDLIALLQVLLTPMHDFALAQVLRSPIFNFGEEQLQYLAHASQHQVDHLGSSSWWTVLEKSHQAELNQVYQMIHSWIDLSKRLPIHDLLDRIYADAQLKKVYAQAVPDLERPRVLANLDEFLRLALDVDGGRYPSLSRFMYELGRLKRGDQEETPDEGDMADLDSTTSSEFTDLAATSNPQEGVVNAMTIHAAKGLEAPFVFLMGANKVLSKSQDSSGIVVDWQPHEVLPNFVAPYFGELKSGLVEHALEQEQRIAQTEYLNLLYVAMTRAKQGLVVSGVEAKPTQNSPDGIVKDSWYDLLCQSGVNELPLTEVNFVNPQSASFIPEVSSQTTAYASYSDFSTKDWLTPKFKSQSDFGGIDELASDEQNTAMNLYDSSSADTDAQAQAIQLGVAFHRVLEHVTKPGFVKKFGLIHLSPDLASSFELANWLNIPEEFAQEAYSAAVAVLSVPELQDCFMQESYVNAWNELDVFDSQGRAYRLDRLVELNDRLVILDYKLSIPSVQNDLHQGYVAQLQKYCSLVKSLRADKPIHACMVDPSGQLFWIK